MFEGKLIDAMMLTLSYSSNQPLNMARELLECKQAILPGPQVPSRWFGGVVWFSSLITLNWFKCVENVPCGSRKSDTMAHLRWSRLEA